MRFRTVGSAVKSAFILVLLTIAGGSLASAQGFQWIYGGNNSEAGRGGVRPVTAGGYIAAGESFSPSGGGSSDILVLRTNDDGSLAWMQTFNIGGNDSALDIEEVPADGGFIVCGVTDNDPCGGRRDIFLLRLDPCGKVMWVNTYGTSSTDDMGWDVIVTQIGDASCGTSAGDFVVAGSTGAPGGQLDGYLIRVRDGAPPNLLWGKTYDGPCSNTDYFYGVAEMVTGAQGGDRGDLVAVGGTRSWCNPAFGATDAFIVRVAGCSGKIDGSGARGAAVYGDQYMQDLRSVTEITLNGNCEGNIACVGYTDAPNANGVINHDVYLLETAAHPCRPVGDLRIGDLNDDEGYCIREVPKGHPDAGQLVVTGYMELPNGFGGKDAFMQRFDACAFGIIPPFTHIYGGTGTEWGWSVNAVSESLPCRSAGYIMTGLEDTWSGSQQLYLVKTDPFGLRSGCHEADVEPVRNTPNLQVSCVEPAIAELERECRPEIKNECQTWHDLLCYFDAGTRPCQIPACECSPGAFPKQGSGSESVSFLGAGTVGIYPNPAPRDAQLTLEYTFVKETEGTLTVSDMAGRVVRSERVTFKAGASTLPIATTGWSAGAYVVDVKVGKESKTMRVVLGAR